MDVGNSSAHLEIERELILSLVFNSGSLIALNHVRQPSTIRQMMWYNGDNFSISAGLDLSFSPT